MNETWRWPIEAVVAWWCRSEELEAEATPWDIIEAMGTGGQRGGSRGRRHPALPHR